MAKQDIKDKGTPDRQRWAKWVAQAQKDAKEFWDNGDKVVSVYRIEERERSVTQRDKYNILYSNTETIKPSLYAQMPKVEVKTQQKDSTNPIARAASAVLEASISYQLNEQKDDFDEVMKDVVQDCLLPGLGTVWVRYVPTIEPLMSDSKPVTGEDGNPLDQVTYETVQIDYVNWKDLLWSKGRRWNEVWWVSRSVWMDKREFAKRFGEEKANATTFTTSGENDTRRPNDESVDEGQACVHEIWDKKRKQQVFYCETYLEDLLDVRDDPLKLTGFFPTPRPLRAITTSNKMTPRPYYAQYQAQADELNDVTLRIRRLVDALRVIGVYDASVEKLKDLLSGTGNKMVPVEGWSTIAEKGGLKGTVDFVPITEIANALMQLYDARDRIKNEIYEITGWSDIIRGVSKASETLGAQKLKSDWAGSRLKLQQRDVQRFIRDTLRIVGEIISEQFQPQSIAVCCGLQYAPQDDETVQLFAQIVKVLKEDKSRCSLVSIETDSTLMPDEANDKAERMEFVGAAGAFLQQAVPAMQTMPAMGPLLASILMFAIRSFRSARPLEQEFEQFIQAVQNGGVPPPNDGKGGSGGGDDPQAKAQAAMATVQQKAQSDSLKAATEDKKVQADMAQHSDEMAIEREKENNRHAEKMRELDLREREVAVQEAQLGIQQRAQVLNEQTADSDAYFKDRSEARADRGEDRADREENKPDPT